MTSVARRLPSGACLRVDWLGTTLSSVRTDVSLIPASASKITTAAVALEVLGAEYTFETQVFADPLSPSGVTQNLYVLGGGDPLLVTANYTALERYPTINGTSLDTLVASIANAGVKQIAGSIVVIDSRYDQKRFIDQWPSSFHGVEAGPLGALMFNDVVITGEALKPDDPGIGAGQELGILLAQRGIGVAAGTQRGSAVPSSATKVASITSAPLTAVLQEMLVNSDNNTAEILVKELGYVKKGIGSTSAGLEVVAETVKTWAVGDPVSVDGSGLSSANSSTCDFFMGILDRNKETFPSLLAVAGKTGTLKTSFIDSPVEDRLVAKTGTLTGVKALVGYLPLDAEEDVKFSLLMNASGIDNQSSYRPIWNALGDALNRARSTPRPEQLSP
jgi:D-alanyl-D-alanine carboxypeptidase/D-alanyl-D-alanine-endopeptidase (penicillin-binding protein 4)